MHITYCAGPMLNPSIAKTTFSNWGGSQRSESVVEQVWLPGFVNLDNCSSSSTASISSVTYAVSPWFINLIAGAAWWSVLKILCFPSCMLTLSDCPFDQPSPISVIMGFWRCDKVWMPRAGKELREFLILSCDPFLLQSPSCCSIATGISSKEILIV